MGARAVWALNNFTVFACMAGTAVISLMSLKDNSEGNEHILPNETTRTAAVIVFALLGFPLAVSVLSKPKSFFFLLQYFYLMINPCFFLLCRLHTVSLSQSQQKSLLIQEAVKVCEKIQSFIALCLNFGFQNLKWFHHFVFVLNAGLAIGVLNLAIVIPQVSSQIHYLCFMLLKSCTK